LSLLEEFAARCPEAPVESCWPWMGVCHSDGYGLLNYEGKQFYAHRLSHLFLVGPIPRCYHIDHWCRNPPCINPLHIEAVHQQLNLLRGVGRSALHFACVHGHPFTPENTWWNLKKGVRACRACNRIRQQQLVERRHSLGLTKYGTVPKIAWQDRSARRAYLDVGAC
jgi:hypothetical protein